jgi:transposase
VWVDEAGFYLLPARVRTWAPIGQPPVIRAPCSYDHLNVISAITPSGKLYMQVYDDPICGPQVVRFLQHLLGQLEGKLLVIWDGASIHHGLAVKEFLAAGGSERIHLERLPGYAPDLNPDEGIWGYLKRRELGNVVCRTSAELRYELRLAVARLRHKPHVIRGCITQAGLVV